MGKKAKLDFAIEFIKHREELGTPFASSRYLARAVAREVSGYKRVVELGAGQGQVTRRILKENPGLVSLTAFEIIPELFEDLLQINDSRLTIVSASAENFIDYVPDFDCVVSGLPLTTMFRKSREIVDKILSDSRSAQRYIQYKYFPSKRLLKDYFEHVRGSMIWRNVPPALIYVCSNNGSESSFLKR